MNARDLPLHASPAALGKVVRAACTNDLRFDRDYHDDDIGPMGDMCAECRWFDDHAPSCSVPDQERAQRIENGDECEKCGGRDIEFSDAITPLFHCRKCGHSRFDFREDE